MVFGAHLDTFSKCDIQFYTIQIPVMGYRIEKKYLY